MLFINLLILIVHQSNTSILSALRNQLLKEVSSLVPSPVKQKVENKGPGIEVKMEDSEQDVGHEDKETLEILQGANSFYCADQCTPK